MAILGLAKKMGLKPGMKVLLKGAPAGFASLLAECGDDVAIVKSASKPVDCVLAFVRSRDEVKTAAPSVLAATIEDGLVWFAYPKKSGSIPSDLTRDQGWAPVYDAGFDSVAQVSIDENWTGFRFRAKHRIGKARK